MHCAVYESYAAKGKHASFKLPLTTSDAPPRGYGRDAVNSCVRRLRQIYINRNQTVVSTIRWDAYFIGFEKSQKPIYGQQGHVFILQLNQFAENCTRRNRNLFRLCNLKLNGHHCRCWGICANIIKLTHTLRLYYMQLIQLFLQFILALQGGEIRLLLVQMG